MKKIITLLTIIAGLPLWAQVGINNSNPQEKLHVSGSTSTIRVEGLNAANNILNLGANENTKVYANANGDLVLSNVPTDIAILFNPENYFVTKQLQRNIYKTFKVKQACRKVIIEQLKLILDDGFPKIIIRTDIKKFYESIPHKELLQKIEENSLLSFPSKRMIKRVLNQYWGILN